jgi:CRP-like cAMP-binding protein
VRGAPIRDDSGVKSTKSGSLDHSRLRAVPTFAGCTDAEIDQLLPGLVMVEADAGEVLVAEGDPGDYAYIIVSGETTVTQSGNRVASMGSGDLFGEMAMVAGGVRTATVRAASAVELLRLDAPSLAAITGTQTIAWNLLQSLLSRIRGDEPAPARSSVAVDDVTGTGALGEHLSVSERVVVAPRVGNFRPSSLDAATEAGTAVASGQLIGYVDSLGEQAEVRTPFAGFFMGMLAAPGERVHAGQPIAWLRTF